MSYDWEESRQSGAEPIECYFFELGASSWSYTSADKEITIPGWSNPFAPAPIVAQREEHGSEDSCGGIVLTVPRALPCIGDFVAYMPANRLKLTVIQLHRKEPALIDEITPFRGWVVTVGWEDDGLAKLTCRPVTYELDRPTAGICYQRQCNWSLFSPGCGVVSSQYTCEALVTAIVDNTISSPDFDAEPDGYFNAGFVLWSGQRRFVVEHLGPVLTLMSPFQGLTAGQWVVAYPGCDGTEAMCAARFSNLDRHLGFARVPWRNPHTRRAF